MSQTNAQMSDLEVGALALGALVGGVVGLWLFGRSGGLIGAILGMALGYVLSRGRQ